MPANYNEIIKTYEKENIINKIETDEKPGSLHYIPHRAVIKNERETVKTCILFDVPSKTEKNLSLTVYRLLRVVSGVTGSPF